MEVIKSLSFLLSEFLDIVLWTGAWYVFPGWILIELIVYTIIIFMKSKKVSRNNWKKIYIKRVGIIGMFLLIVRTSLTMFMIFITFSTHLTIELLSFTSYLLTGAVLASVTTVWVLVKFHSMQLEGVKVYLILLSIPITLFYIVAIHIAIF